MVKQASMNAVIKAGAEHAFQIWDLYTDER
jgi:hypothetical protein